MGPSVWQFAVVLVIVLVLFGGRGKISQLMGDFGKGLKSFKKGIKEDPDGPIAGPGTDDVGSNAEMRATEAVTEKEAEKDAAKS